MTNIDWYAFQFQLKFDIVFLGLKEFDYNFGICTLTVMLCMYSKILTCDQKYTYQKNQSYQNCITTDQGFQFKAKDMIKK